MHVLVPSLESFDRERLLLDLTNCSKIIRLLNFKWWPPVALAIPLTEVGEPQAKHVQYSRVTTNEGPQVLCSIVFYSQ